MNYTEHYQLSQWEKSDRVLMQDFNADNQKTEDAIDLVENHTSIVQELANNAASAAANAQAAANLAQATADAGVKIISGSYVGNGTYGNSSPNTITFTQKPALFILATANTPHFVPGTVSKCTSDAGTNNTSAWVYFSWNGNTLSWYSSNGANYQSNVSGTTYHYLAVYTST